MNFKISVIFTTALAPLIWGSTYIVTTEFLPPNIPFTAALLRIFPAGLLLLLFKFQWPKKNEWLPIIILGILNLGLFQVLLFVAAYRLSGGLAAILSSTQPLIVMLLLSLIDRQKMPPIAWAAAGTAVIGMTLMLGKSNQQIDTIGIWAALGGALSMALGIYLSKRWKISLSLLSFTGWQLCFGGLFLLPVTLYFETFPTHLNTTNILGFSYLCLVGALLAYILWFRGLQKLPTASVSTLGLLSPVSAYLLGWYFLNQSMNIISFIGFALVLSAIFTTQYILRKQ